MRVSPAEGAQSHLPTWEILGHYIKEQIAKGVYPVGSSLPSVRELASQVDVNRNTVSKTYQALGREGILTVERGRGVRVTAEPAQDRTASARVSASINRLVEEVSLAGLTREWLLDTVRAAADAVYRRRNIRIAFIECTKPDTQQIANDLAHHLGANFEPIDLADFQRDPELVQRKFDLVTTTLFHLHEVSAALPSCPDRIVGINHAVSHKSILDVARLPPGRTIVIVGPNARTVERVKSIVETYATGTVYTSTLDDQAKLAKTLAIADVVVDNSTTHESVARLAPDVPAITISFHIEHQSIEYLRTVVRTLLTEGRPPPRD